MPRLPQPRNRKEAEGNAEFVRSLGTVEQFKADLMKRHGFTTEAEYKAWMRAKANSILFGEEGP